MRDITSVSLRLILEEVENDEYFFSQCSDDRSNDGDVCINITAGVVDGYSSDLEEGIKKWLPYFTTVL
jgi:hypothetical protein